MGNYAVYYPLGIVDFPVLEDCVCVSIDPAVTTFAIRVERRQGKQVETVMMELWNLTSSRSKKKITPDVLNTLTCRLDAWHDTLKQANVVMIERQMAMNGPAMRIFQHTMTYFSLYAPRYISPCLVIDVSPKLKKCVLGPSGKMSYNQTKTWGIKTANALLTERGDEKGLDAISHHRKKDDLSDTVIQAEAWFRHTMNL